MIVTDITRMDGDRVCVGGYLDDGTAVPPVAGRVGPNEQWLRSARDGRVAPFAVLELQINKAPKRLTAPHTEDRTIPLKGHRVLSILSDEDQKALLNRTVSPSVRSVFGAEIHTDSVGQWGDGMFALVKARGRLARSRSIASRPSSTATTPTGAGGTIASGFAMGRKRSFSLP